MGNARAGIDFGIFPSPRADSLEEIVALVQRAEDLGLELVGIQDHPYQRRFLDAFLLMTHLAAVTERIRFFPDVTHLPLRPPAMLAKQAASLDRLSDGRFELGLGAGGFDDASRAMGGVARTGPQKLAATEEAIDILRTFWSTPERGITFEGEYYRLGGVKAGPAPAHDIGIWIGAAGPRMLELIGRKADGWVASSPWAPPEKLEEGNQRIDAAAQDAGRDPDEIRRVYNVNGLITDGASEGRLHGPTEQWVDELVELAVDHRVDAFVYWADRDTDEQLGRFAEVAAAVRQAAGTVSP